MNSPVAVPSPSPYPDHASANLWPLLSIIAAIFLWLGADELRQRVQETEQQLTSAAKRVSRGSPQEVAARQNEAKRIEARRQSLAQRLSSSESEQMTRAKLVFELRQKCNAVPVACQVRLADLSNAATLKRRAAEADAELSLEGLGVSRARAVLFGNFKSSELIGLYKAFAQDPDAQWKVNALLVKGTSFELDLERLVLRQGGATQP